MLRSGLIVKVPEAEPAVHNLRSHLDPVAALGVPAHITVLFPFAPPASLSGAAHSTLRGLFSNITAFDFRLVATRWFDHTVLWLAPDPNAQFLALTHAVADEFPAYPPYDGQFSDVIPHLTVADCGPADAMRAAEQRLQPTLPIKSTARSVSLMCELPSGLWQETATYALRAR